MSYAPDDVVAGELQLRTEPDREALSVHDLIRRHHNSLMHFLSRRLRVAEDAADVAQETYIRLLQYEGSREIHSPSSLLFRIAINVAHDLGRTEQTRQAGKQCQIDDLDLPSDQPTPEREISGQQDLAILYQAIADLPPKCQQAFLLSRVRHMTYPEIGRHCGISVKMVEKHISHALTVLLKKVGEGRQNPS
jgi:RNA polymerase sigma factor (sigma-70 family)